MRSVIFLTYKKLAFRYSSCKSVRMREVGVASWLLLLLPMLLPWSSNGLPAELDTYPLTKERGRIMISLIKKQMKNAKAMKSADFHGVSFF
jgi:hypothetical protein